MLQKEDYESCGVAGLSKSCNESRMFPVTSSKTLLSLTRSQKSLR